MKRCHALSASAITLCAALLSGSIFADSTSPPECLSNEAGDNSEAALAVRLSCYNNELDGLSLLIGDLLEERAQISALLDGSAAVQIQQDGAEQHLETIEQLRMERSNLSAQLHKELIEKQERLLNKEAEERLLRNYSQAYLAIADENAELVARISTLNQQIESLTAESSTLTATNQQLMSDNQSFKDSIDELSARNLQLSQAATKKDTTIAKLRAQLLETATLSEQLSAKSAGHQSEIAALTQSNRIAQFNIESLNKAAAGFATSRTAERQHTAQQVSELQNQLALLQTNYQSLESDAQQAAAKATELQNSQTAEIDKLNQDLLTHQKTRDALQAQLEAADQLLAEQNDALVQANNDSAEQQQIITSLNDELVQLNLQLTEQQQLLNAASANAEEQTAKVATTMQDLEQAREALGAANESLANANRRIDELESLNTSMSAQISEATTDADNLQSSLNAANAELTQVSQARSTAAAASESLLETNEALRKRLQTIDNELSNATEKALAQQTQIDELNLDKEQSAAEAESLRNKIASLQGLLDTSQSNNEAFAQSLESIKSELLASNERLNDQQSQLQSLVLEKEAIVTALNQSKTDTDALARTIADTLAANQAEAVTVDVMPDNTIGLKIASSELFRVGSSRLSRDGRALLKQVGTAVVDQSKRRILIEGHSDNLPLGPKLAQRFTDNTGLSLARARSAASSLVEDASIPQQQLSITGAGASRPLASNESEEGRQQNRRVEILLLPVEYSPATDIGATE